jgi:hypothetical protein
LKVTIDLRKFAKDGKRKPMQGKYIKLLVLVIVAILGLIYGCEEGGWML